MALCIFDPDYDNRLKSHIDPSRTVLMKEPERSFLTNPYLYRASKYNVNESIRQEPKIVKSRVIVDNSVHSVAEACTLLRQSADMGDFKKPVTLSTGQQVYIKTKYEYPKDDKSLIQLPPMVDENGKPTETFYLMIDRIHDIALEEKERAREIGRQEGLLAGFDIYQQKLQNGDLDVQKAINEYQYEDRSDKYDKTLGTGIAIGNDRNEALKILEQVWKSMDAQGISGR